MKTVKELTEALQRDGIEKTTTVLVERAVHMPARTQDCLVLIIEICRVCETRNVIKILSDYGIQHPETRETCLTFVAGVCDASSKDF